MIFGRQIYWVSVRCNWSGIICPGDKREKSRDLQNKFATVRYELKIFKDLKTILIFNDLFDYSIQYLYIL